MPRAKIVRGPCSVEGCETISRTRGWCRVHYRRWVRHGDPNVLLRQKGPADGICVIEECTNVAHARGWCTTHHMRWQTHGDPTITLTPNRSKYDTCTKQDCDNPHHCKGLCESHYKRMRINKDINLRIKERLRTRMYIAVRSVQKSGSAVRDLGCSISSFKLFIENQFEDGMNWDNYGDWHLDHVMPLAYYDLTDRSQFLEAANWLNYQPLWAIDNLQKSASI